MLIRTEKHQDRWIFQQGLLFIWLDAGLLDIWLASSLTIIYNTLSCKRLTQPQLSRLSIVKANDETSSLLTVNHTFSYLSPVRCYYWLY